MNTKSSESASPTESASFPPKMENGSLKVWFIILLAFSVVAAAFIVYVTAFDPSVIRLHLVRLIPLWLEINFALILIALSVNFKTLYSLFTTMEKPHKYCLAAIILFAFTSAFFIAPKVHRIFFDENIYLNIGQNMGYLGKASMCNDGDNTYGVYKCAADEFNKQPYAYPFILGMVFRLAGNSEDLGFLLNNLFFCMSAVVVFLISHHLFGDIRTSLFSALIYVLIPHNIIWGNTTAVEPSTALFTGMALLALLHFLKERNTRALFLLSAVLPFSLQFRFESVLILPAMLLSILLYDGKILKSKAFYWFMLLSLMLVLAHVLQLYSVRSESWGASGDKLSLSFMLKNLSSNAIFYLDNRRFPTVFTILSAIGIFYKRDFLKERLVTVTWFLLLWGVFLAFYAGSYDFGQDVRYSLVSYMPISVLAGLGLCRIENIIKDTKFSKYALTVFAIILFIDFSVHLPSIRAEGEEAWECRIDYSQAKKMLSMVDKENSVILTQNPSMFLLWGANAAQTSTLNYNLDRMNYFFDRYGQNVYFHYNYWCNVDDPVQKKFCQDILNTYDCEKISYYTEQHRIFALYRLKRK
ncbi:MAG: glycosyltransferase family 39 protein [Nitrospirae bacterium]|nr:glycosyltransferase family 39 protein [Nitrospirota bacterium]